MTERSIGGKSDSAGWIRELVENERQREADAKAAGDRTARRKNEFAGAATAMLTRLHALFDGAATAFNTQSSTANPVALTRLKGGGFVVARGPSRLTVLKTSDWNIVFSYTSPPRLDLFALVSRAEGNAIGWHLYRKKDDQDSFEASPTEPGDVAERIASRLFRRLVQTSRPVRAK